MTLDSRKGRILQAIVNDYVEIGEPVGSELLASRHDFGCRPATLRNEMAEMSDLGYLVQPHTSAGRIPSHRGYRYYVDRLMQPLTLGRTQRTALLSSDPARMAVEEIVQLTCRMLSDMTHYPSIGTPPSASAAVLHRVYVTPADTHHALVVLLLSTGHVEHHLLAVEAPPSEASLQRVTNYLNEHLAGRSLTEVAAAALGELPAEVYGDRGLLAAVHACIVDAARDLADGRVFLEGTSHLLRQREFQDVLRLEQLLAALDERSVLSQVLQVALLGQSVTVIIGTEGPVEAMHECSVVTSTYRIRERAGGFIGVVGPTRMHYDRTVAAVDLMAQSLSSVLTRASLG